MQYNTTIKDMSNYELSSAISRKRSLVDHKKSKGEDSKEDEMNLCYLQRELQLRNHRRSKHPECCISQGNSQN